jgi:hypothetical protein
MNTQAKLLKLARWSVALATLATAGEAAAFFDAQVLVGKRWYSLESDGEKSGVQSQEIALAAHLDPIPLVPVSFGASVAIGTLRKDDIGGDTGSVVEPALEVCGWLPMVPFVTPYARLKIPVMSTLIMKGKTDLGTEEVDYVATSKLSGYHLNVGAKWSPLPVVKLLVEIGKGMETSKLDEYKLDGSKEDVDAESVKANSDNFMIGVEIGI